MADFALATAYVDLQPKNIDKLKSAFEMIKRDGKKAVDTVSNEIAKTKWSQITTGAHRAFTTLKNAAVSTFAVIRRNILNLRTAFVGLLAGSAIGGLLKVFSNYEDALVAMGRVSDESLTVIKDRIRLIGPEFGSQTELMRGYYQVISAGARDAATSVDTLKEAAKISKVTHVEQGEVVRALVPLYKSYKDEIEGVAEAADILYGIEKGGITTVGELIPYVGSLSGLAHTTGLNIQEMAGALAQITTTGAGTAQSVTRLQRLMVSLNNPTAELNELFRAQGGVFNAIKTSGFVKVMEDIYTATGGASEELDKFLGGRIEAKLGFLALMQDGFAGTKEQIDRMETSTGLAEKAFHDYEGTVTGIIDVMKDSIGNTLLGLIEKNSDRIKAALEHLKDWIVDNEENFWKIGEAIANSLDWAVKAVSRFIDWMHQQKEFQDLIYPEEEETIFKARVKESIDYLKMLLTPIWAKPKADIWDKDISSTREFTEDVGHLQRSMEGVADGVGLINQSMLDADKTMLQTVKNWSANTVIQNKIAVASWVRTARDLTEEEKKMFDQMSNERELYYEGFDISNRNVIAQARYLSDKIIEENKKIGRSWEEIDKDAIQKLTYNVERFGELYYEEQEDLTAKTIAETKKRTDEMIKASKESSSGMKEQWGLGLQDMSKQLEEHSTTWRTVSYQTAGAMRNSFSDSFFSLMKGDISDLGDAWKGFLDSVLRSISDFFADSLVKQLLGFFDRDWTIKSGGGGGGGFDLGTLAGAAIGGISKAAGGATDLLKKGWDVVSGFLGFGQTGGLVPGPEGKPYLLVVHGGEAIVPSDSIMDTVSAKGGLKPVDWYNVNESAADRSAPDFSKGVGGFGDLFGGGYGEVALSALAGMLSGGPLGAATSAFGALGRKTAKEQVGYRGGWFDVPSRMAGVLGPIGSMLSPAIGAIGDLIGDWFNARGDEEIRDALKENLGYVAGHQAYAPMYDAIKNFADDVLAEMEKTAKETENQVKETTPAITRSFDITRKGFEDIGKEAEKTTPTATQAITKLGTTFDDLFEAYDAVSMETTDIALEVTEKAKQSFTTLGYDFDDMYNAWSNTISTSTEQYESMTTAQVEAQLQTLDNIAAAYDATREMTEGWTQAAQETTNSMVDVGVSTTNAAETAKETAAVTGYAAEVAGEAREAAREAKEATREAKEAGRGSEGGGFGGYDVGGTEGDYEAGMGSYGGGGGFNDQSDATEGFYQHGTAYVPRTGRAIVHEGEKITPAWANKQGEGRPMQLIIELPGERFMRYIDTRIDVNRVKLNRRQTPNVGTNRYLR